MSYVGVDSSFLIGLYDTGDQYNPVAEGHFQELFHHGDNHMVIPWPVLYESVSTRMVKKQAGLRRLQEDWKRMRRRQRLELLPDDEYRGQVIEDCFEELGKPGTRYRALSAVDRVIRYMLQDGKNHIGAFVTFNPSDFSDICKRFKIEMICAQVPL